MEENFIPAISAFVPKIITATLCGAVVGFDRELKNKVAGIKTYILICVGTTLFTKISFIISGDQHDPTRIISQIITGIGFLGAGMIFKGEQRVHGLTTAAFVWIVAAMGVLIGCGGELVAIALTVGLLVTLYTVTTIGYRFLKYFK